MFALALKASRVYVAKLEPRQRRPNAMQVQVVHRYHDSLSKTLPSTETYNTVAVYTKNKLFNADHATNRGTLDGAAAMWLRRRRKRASTLATIAGVHLTG